MINQEELPASGSPAAMRKRIDALTPVQQHAVLQKLIDRKIHATAKRKAETFDLQPQPRDRDFPLSYEQAYLWDRHRVSGYKVDFVMDMPPLVLSDLNLATLEECLSILVGRHESLRTTFHVAEGQEDGDLVQRIHPAEPYQLEVVEFSRLRVLGIEQIVAEQAQAMAMEPFDLESGPLWRCKLLKRGNDGALLFVFCALTFDGGSIKIFFDELMALYQAKQESRPISLPPIEIHYADYADWQQRHIQRPEQQANLQWWQDRLGGYQELRLGNRKTGLLNQTYECVLFEHVVRSELLTKLEIYAKEQDVTLFMVMLTAFKMLLAEFSGQEDIVVGTPVSRRQIPQTQPMIGHFVNYLALRSLLPADQDFGATLQQVSAITLDAFEHQTTPHGLLLPPVVSAAEEGPSPFRVIFNYRNVGNPDFIDEQIRAGAEENAPQENFQVKDLSRQFLRDEDLLLRIEDAGPHKVATWFVRSDILDADAIGLMVARYQEILNGI